MNKEKDTKNAEISARIAEILQYTGETRNSFAIKLGYERAQTVYDIMNMKSAPSYDFFRRFSMSEYSDIIDLKWLLSGKGSMLRSDYPKSLHSQPTEETLSTVSSSNDIVVLRLMDKLDEKDKIIKEKDVKIDQIQCELRSMGEKLATIRTQLSHYEPSPPPSIKEKENISDLCDAGTASLDITTQKPSSHTKKVESATAP
jgi:hypothetical protein|nr:MAG TPA: sigma factor [Caudoviricetes sp.]